MTTAFASPLTLPYHVRPVPKTPLHARTPTLVMPAAKTSQVPATLTVSTPPKPQTSPSKWSVVACAAVVHALHATAVYMAPATLLSPMRASLNLTVAEITQPLILYRSINAIFLLPAGYILDKVGPQRCLRYSVLAAALAAPLLAMGTNLTHLLALQAFFAVSKLFGGLSAMFLLVSKVFPDGKGVGTATGILLGGYSFAGFFAPAVIGTLANGYGWRVATFILAMVFSVVALPLTFMFLKEPGGPPKLTWGRGFASKLMGMRLNSGSRTQGAEELVQDADASGMRSSMSGSDIDSVEILKSSRLVSHRRTPVLRRHRLAGRVTGTMTTSDSLSTQNRAGGELEVDEPFFSGPFLTISAAVFFFSISMHVLFDHLIVFLSEDFGMPFEKATMVMSAVNLIALFTKLGVGPLADRFNKALLMTVFGAVAAVGCFALLDFTGVGFVVTTSLTKVMLFTVMYSIGYAAVFNLTTAVLPEFGKQKLGLRSTFNLVLLFGSGSLGSYAAGLVRSTVGSYRWPFLWSALSFVVVCIAGLFKYFVYDRRQQRVPAAADR